MWKKTGKIIMKRLLLVILLILTFTVAALALEIEAHVDRENITVNESINLTVTITGGPGDVDVSTIKDFRVVSQSSSTNIQIINSKISKQISYTYRLAPLQKGRLIIPTLEVTSKGNVYRTEKIIIQVSDQPAQATQTNELFAKSLISENDPFVGQQIIYTFKLYRAVQVANLRFQEPGFSGFTAKKMEKDKTYRTTLSGKEYIVNELTYVLVPLKSGEVTLAPAIISCDVVYRRAGRKRRSFDSFFNNPFFSGSELKPRVVHSNPLVIKVNTLPVHQGEVRFSGLVGHFEMTATVEEDRVNVGESTTLSITLSGTGNIMDAEEPQVNVSDAVKVYKDTPAEDIVINSKGISGKKVFRSALVPVLEGRYVIDPVKLNYFNTDEGRYKTISTNSIVVFANQSREKEKVEVFKAPIQSPPMKIKKKKVEFTGRDILPLKQDLDALENKKLVPLNRFLIFLLIPFLLFVVVKIVLLFTRKNHSTEKIMMDRADHALKKACKIDVSGEEFLSCLYLALISAIHSKSGTKGESLTYAEAEKVLLTRGYSKEIAGEAATLLNQIESAKYSGADIAVDRKEKLLVKTRAFIKGLFQ